jgi:hypothetical protein
MARDPQAMNKNMKKKLAQISREGKLAGGDNRTMNALFRRGYVRETTKGWALTAAGKKALQ